jgi:hypothetical protein
MIGTADPSLLVRQLGDEVTGTVTDDVAGVASVTVTFSDVVFGGSTTVAATLSCGPGALSCTWSAAPPGSGMFDVKATSVDAVGNAEDPGAGPVRVLVA